MVVDVMTLKYYGIKSISGLTQSDGMKGYM